MGMGSVYGHPTSIAFPGAARGAGAMKMAPDDDSDDDSDDGAETSALIRSVDQSGYGNFDINHDSPLNHTSHPCGNFDIV